MNPDAKAPLLFIVLLCAVVLLLVAYFSLRKKYKLVRYLFIESSDWNGAKINELVECAEGLCLELARLQNEKAIRELENFEKEIEAWKPYVLRDAKSEWMEQKDKFQQILIANKVKPLTMSDYYVVLAGTYKLS